jgi:hypothetical protein
MTVYEFCVSIGAHSEVVAGVTVKFEILNPLDGFVDLPTVVTIKAYDQHGNVAIQESRRVTLVATGSATGAGTFSFNAGSIHITISDSVEETVDLSLVDVDSTNVDVSSTQNVVFVAKPRTSSYSGFGSR